MKAIVIDRYGLPDVLLPQEIQKPVPGDNEVLVRVHAASVNFNTLMFIKGEPFVGRFWTGLRKPKLKIPGNDIAGRIEEKGSNVTQFQAGDEVFGDTALCGFGAFAEYVSVPANILTHKPSNISFEEAAAVPEAGLVALQALRDAGKIREGQEVMIYGASGGIGSFAVQIARYFGARVIGVCGPGNMEMVNSLGADHVMDYTKEDFTRTGRQFDLIVATAGYRPIFDYKRMLKPGGTYIATGGSMKQIFQALLLGPWISMAGKTKLMSLTLKPNMGLDFMKELLETGKVKPVIDRHYPLNEAAAALQYYGLGHSKGKVIITI